jgi:hypothetical protein
VFDVCATDDFGPAPAVRRFSGVAHAPRDLGRLRTRLLVSFYADRFESGDLALYPIRRVALRGRARIDGLVRYRGRGEGRSTTAAHAGPNATLEVNVASASRPWRASGAASARRWRGASPTAGRWACLLLGRRFTQRPPRPP